MQRFVESFLKRLLCFNVIKKFNKLKDQRPKFFRLADLGEQLVKHPKKIFARQSLMKLEPLSVASVYTFCADFHITAPRDAKQFFFIIADLIRLRGNPAGDAQAGIALDRFPKIKKRDGRFFFKDNLRNFFLDFFDSLFLL